MDEVEDAKARLRFYLDACGAVGRKRPIVRFVSASPDLVAGVVRCLGVLGIAARPRPRPTGRSVEVQISNRADVLHLLDAAMPTVPGKRETAEALVRFLRDPGRRWPPGAEELRRAYWDEGLDLRGVGERFGYTASGICRLMERHGVPRRPQGGGRRRD